MPKGMADQDKSMDCSSHEATNGLSETKANVSCGFLSVDLRERFRSDFPGVKDMPTDDDLKERYRNVQFTASQTAPSQAKPTETDTSEPKKDSEDGESFRIITEKPKETYSDRLMAATKGEPASFTMKSKARRKSQALSENSTPDPFKTEQESEGAHAMPKLAGPRRGPGLKTFVKSVSMKFSLKNSTIDMNTTSDDGSVKSSASKSLKKKEVRKMKNGEEGDAQRDGDDSFFPSRTLTPKGAKARRGPAGALFKMTSILKFDKDVDWGAKSETQKPIINQVKAEEIALIIEDAWVEPSADSKGKTEKHDSSRTCSDLRPR